MLPYQHYTNLWEVSCDLKAKLNIDKKTNDFMAVDQQRSVCHYYQLQQQKRMVDLKTFVIVMASLTIMFNLIFVVLFVRRVRKLFRLAINKQLTITYMTWLKFIVVGTLICLYFIDIILAYSSQSYWLYPYQSFSLVNLIIIANYSLQLVILVQQVKKSMIRVVSVPLFWLVSLVNEVITVITVEIENPNSGNILLIFTAICNIGLISLTLVFDHQPSSADLVFLRSEHSERQTNFLEKSSFEHRQSSNKKIYIEFNKQFEVTISESNYSCEFKIAVYFNEQVKIIAKSQQQFLQLGQEMERAFPQDPAARINHEQLKDSYENMMKYGQERQKVYQNYLIEVVRHLHYYSNTLLDFLEIKSSARNSFTREDLTASLLQRQNTNDEGYKTPFFSVTANKDKYIISNPEILELIVNKTSDEIVEFQNQLLQTKRLTMEFLSEPPQTSEIIHFFSRVVNSKSLWRQFCDWFLLGKQIEQKIYKFFDTWQIGFKLIQMEIIGHQIAFDKQGKIHTLYLLKIQRKNHQISDRNSNILKKRFNDFFYLDKHVRKFLSNHKKQASRLVSLPPKFSPFGSKTSPKSRQVQFDLYIKELLKIENINHCIKFLQFLEIGTQNNSNSLYQSVGIEYHDQSESQKSNITQILMKSDSGYSQKMEQEED